MHAIRSTVELNEKLGEAGDKLVVIDFFAIWCGPCKIIAPKIEELSKDNPDVIFYKIDVDDCDEEVITKYNIDSMPTFIFIKNKEEVDKVIGSNFEKVKSAVEKHK